MKLKLYHKTFITSFVTTLLTLAAFLIILQSFTGMFLNKLADDQFNNAIKEVQKITKLEDFTIDNIHKIEENNQTTIRLYDVNNQIIYPRIGLVTSAGSIQSEPALVNPDSKELRVTTEILNIEGNSVIALISYNANMRTEEVQQVFIKMIPSLTVIAVLMSLLVSYIYSKQTVKKIQNMNDKMLLMSDINYDEAYDKQDGDELSDLENHIHDLYDKLISEMETIKKFEMDRQVFMRGTIHELKTPIMVMEMQLRDLFESEDLSDEDLEKLLSIQKRLDAMRQLVNGGLDISKLESITERSEIDIKDSIDEVLEYYESMVEDRNLKLDVLTTSHLMMMHEKHLTTILSNLMSNAIRYSPNNSTLIITQDNQIFQIKNKIEKDIDNFESLSKPFVRGIKDEDGHGLGMYIVTSTLQKYQLNYKYYLEDDYFVFEFEL